MPHQFTVGICVKVDVEILFQELANGGDGELTMLLKLPQFFLPGTGLFGRDRPATDSQL